MITTIVLLLLIILMIGMSLWLWKNMNKKCRCSPFCFPEYLDNHNEIDKDKKDKWKDKSDRPMIRYGKNEEKESNLTNVEVE